MFFSEYFSFPCQYRSTIAPYSFIHLPPTLYNVFLPALQFSPVSTIPPLLHTHPSIYHPHSIIFFSQHYSFPCQYHSTIAPYSSIHLPPTLYNIFLPALQFPLSVSFHHCSFLISMYSCCYQYKFTQPLNRTKCNCLSEILENWIEEQTVRLQWARVL